MNSANQLDDRKQAYKSYSFKSLKKYFEWMKISEDAYTGANLDAYQRKAKQQLAVCIENKDKKRIQTLSQKIDNYTIYDWQYERCIERDEEYAYIISQYSNQDSINLGFILDQAYLLKFDLENIKTSKDLIQHYISTLPYLHNYFSHLSPYPAFKAGSLPTIRISEFNHLHFLEYFNLITYCLLIYDAENGFQWVPMNMMNELGSNENIRGVIAAVVNLLFFRKSSFVAKFDLKQNTANLQNLYSLGILFFDFLQFGFLLHPEQQFRDKSLGNLSTLNADMFSSILLLNFCLQTKMDLSFLMISMAAILFYSEIMDKIQFPSDTKNVLFDARYNTLKSTLHSALGKDSVVFDQVYNKLQVLFSPTLKSNFKITVL